jgi:hypothetical protein
MDQRGDHAVPGPSSTIVLVISNLNKNVKTVLLYYLYHNSIQQTIDMLTLTKEILTMKMNHQNGNWKSQL